MSITHLEDVVVPKRIVWSREWAWLLVPMWIGLLLLYGVLFISVRLGDSDTEVQYHAWRALFAPSWQTFVATALTNYAQTFAMWSVVALPATVVTCGWAARQLTSRGRWGAALGAAAAGLCWGLAEAALRTDPWPLAPAARAVWGAVGPAAAVVLAVAPVVLVVGMLTLVRGTYRRGAPALPPALSNRDDG